MRADARAGRSYRATFCGTGGYEKSRPGAAFYEGLNGLVVVDFLVLGVFDFAGGDFKVVA